jgi:hypothetical protein
MSPFRVPIRPVTCKFLIQSTWGCIVLLSPSCTLSLLEGAPHTVLIHICTNLKVSTLRSMLALGARGAALPYLPATSSTTLRVGDRVRVRVRALADTITFTITFTITITATFATGPLVLPKHLSLLCPLALAHDLNLIVEPRLL